MRKNILSNLILTIVLVIIICGVLSINVQAISASLSASSTNVTVGTKVTITISWNAASWNLQVSGDGITTENYADVTDDAENGSFTDSLSFTPTEPGTHTINLTGTITDTNSDNDSPPVNKSITVTVKAKATSSGGDSEESGNSGGNSNKPSDTEEEAPSISFSSRNETVYAIDSVNVRSSCTTSNSDNIIGSLEVGQSVTRTGVGSGWSRITYNGQTAYVSSDYLDTKNPLDTEEEPDEEKPEETDEEKSNVKTLSSLTVEQYSLEPEFSPDITEYSLTVGGDVEKLDIGAIAEDTNATIEITGNTGLLIGENTVNVKVTAEDGTVRTYTINVTKVADVGVQLSELSVENYTLTPEFSSNVYEYTLNIGDTSITSLNVNVKSDNENVVIEVAGNNDLKLGKNVITILVTSEDDNLTTTYQIVVNIDEAYKQNTQIIAGIDDKDLYMYIGIGVAVLIILIIIIVVIVRKRRDAKEDEEEDEDFAPLNTYSLDNFSNDDKSAKLENTDLDSNKDATMSDEIEEDNKSKKRREKLEEFSSYASSTDSDTNTTPRRKGKHF